MNQEIKKPLIVTAFGVILYVCLNNLSAIGSFAQSIIQMIMPIIVGGIIALFLHVPINGLQKRLTKLFKNAKKKPSEQSIQIASFLITVIGIAAFLIIFLTTLVPQLAQSSQSLYVQLQERVAYYSQRDYELGWVEDLISKIDVKNITDSITGSMNGILSNAVGVISSTVSVITTAGFALIISIYISLGKKNLKRHLNLIMDAYMKPGAVKRIKHVWRVFLDSFTHFLSGQCGEAIILGTLMFIAFTIAQLPYAILVGCLTAICAIIPYIGAFISGATSVFLILVLDPTLALRSLIVYLSVQFIENQFIYPRVVGKSVGLSPFYTLIAALIGANLFGVVGILFFIPIAATIYSLLREDVHKKVRS